MTNKTYPQTRYILYLLIPELIILIPIRIVGIVALFISNSCLRLIRLLDKMFPCPYVQTMVEFDQLTSREQKIVKEIDRLHG